MAWNRFGWQESFSACFNGRVYCEFCVCPKFLSLKHSWQNHLPKMTSQKVTIFRLVSNLQTKILQKIIILNTCFFLQVLVKYLGTPTFFFGKPQRWKGVFVSTKRRPYPLVASPLWWWMVLWWIHISGLPGRGMRWRFLLGGFVPCAILEAMFPEGRDDWCIVPILNEELKNLRILKITG